MPSLIEPVLITCPVFVNGARGISVTVPGGGTIAYQYPGLWADNAEVCRGLLGQLQGAMVPLTPIYDIINAVLCLKDIVTDVPKAFTDLPAYTDTLKSCLPKLEKLLQLVPQLSVPIFICQVIEVLTCVIDGIITGMQEIINKQVAIDAAAAKANGPTDPLFNIVECANRLNQNRLCTLNESMGPINSIIQLINLFLELIGIEPLGTFGEMAAGATQAIDQFRVLITTLRTVKLAIGCGPLLNVPRC